MTRRHSLLASLLVLTAFPVGLVFGQTASDASSHQETPKAVTTPDMDLREPKVPGLTVTLKTPPATDVPDPPKPTGNGSSIPPSNSVHDLCEDLREAKADLPDFCK